MGVVVVVHAADAMRAAGFVVAALVSVVSLVPAKRHGQLQQVTAASMRVPVCACLCVYVRECVAYWQLP